jgi:hypothetical protein
MTFFSHSSSSMQGKHEPVPPSVDRAFFVAFFATLLLRAFAFKMHSGLREPNQLDGKFNRLI